LEGVSLAESSASVRHKVGLWWRRMRGMHCYGLQIWSCQTKSYVSFQCTSVIL